MSIQADLSLVGNIVVDDTFQVDKWPDEGSSNSSIPDKKSIGGIGNIISALKGAPLSVVATAAVGDDADGQAVRGFLKLNECPARLQVSALPTSRALIVSCAASSERTSFVKWGCGIDLIRLPPWRSRWTHLSYLDVARVDLGALRKASGVLSADLCLSSPGSAAVKAVMTGAKHLDYLFCSKAEASAYFGWTDLLFAARRFLGECGAKRLVIHSKSGTALIGFDGHELIPDETIRLERANTLGAGDAYCAGFIRKMLDGSDWKEASKEGHRTACALVKTRTNSPA